MSPTSGLSAPLAFARRQAGFQPYKLTLSAMPNTVPTGLHYGADSAPALFNRLRTSSKLVESEPDIRLSSPYGAGVSRYVRYPEGTEAGKEKRLF